MTVAYPPGAQIRGVDVSSVQAHVSWDKLVNLGLRFGIAKCTDGPAGADPSYPGNVTGAAAARIPLAPYHYGRPLPGQDAAKQARWFWDHARLVGSRPGDVPAVLDYEFPEPQDWAKRGVDNHGLARWGLDFFAEADRLFVKEPMLYLYPDWEHHLFAGLDSETLAAYGRRRLWLASYAATPPRPPAPWARVTFWQSSGGNKAHTPEGVPVDTDVFEGSEEEFQALLAEGGPVTNPLAGAPVPLDIPGMNAPPEKSDPDQG